MRHDSATGVQGTRHGAVDGALDGPAFIRRKVMPLRPAHTRRARPDRGQGRPAARRGRDRHQRDRGPRAVPAARRVTIDGNRVRFEPGHVRSLAVSTAPREFTQHARNPDKSVVIGGDSVVFAPAYGSPFVRDLAGGRRYASLADFENFVKLTYASPWLHHSGGTICEPVDVPVNKRHLDMVYAHIRYNDQAFMGSVTQPQRARDSVEMARILFGAELPRTALRDPRQRQRQLAARLGQRHDRRDPRLRRGQPGAGRRAVHPRWGDGTGHARRRHRPGARRDDGRRRPRPARAARLAR